MIDPQPLPPQLQPQLQPQLVAMPVPAPPLDDDAASEATVDLDEDYSEHEWP